MQNAASFAHSEESSSEGAFLITSSRPQRRDYAAALAIIVAFAVAALAAAPYARTSLTGTEIFLPAYAAAVVLVEFLTFILLLSVFRIERSSSVLLLALGYFFSAVLVVPWALTFPGVFSTLGLDRGLQATAFIAALRRICFPIFVLAYAVLKGRPSVSPTRFVSSRWFVPACVVAVLAVATAITALALHDDRKLPALMTSTRTASPLWNYVPLVSIFLYALILAVLWLRRRSVLDLWLMVVIGTLLIEFVLLSYVSSGIRFSVGWWVGRSFGLASASVVLLILLSETAALYASLTRTLSAERRGRESRLTALEAFSALIAHEVNQPLASITTNGHAGLRWISRAEPDVEEARAAFERIVSDGHRAGEIVRSIRSVVQNRTPEWVPVDLNRLVTDVVARSRVEARLNRITAEVDLAGDLPLVFGDPTQLRLVIENLFSNAVDAMRASGDRPHVMRLGTTVESAGLVRFELEDNGVGIEPTQWDRIYDPFFTTKQGGMGMGLMLCKHVVEAHGGRLWVAQNEPHGAVFRFTVPRADHSASSPSTAG